MFRLTLLRLVLLIVVMSICDNLPLQTPCNVDSRVPVVYRLGILLMGRVSLVNHWLKYRCHFVFAIIFPLVELNNHVFWTVDFHASYLESGYSLHPIRIFVSPCNCSVCLWWMNTLDFIDYWLYLLINKNPYFGLHSDGYQPSLKIVNSNFTGTVAVGVVSCH